MEPVPIVKRTDRSKVRKIRILYVKKNPECGSLRSGFFFTLIFLKVAFEEI